LRRVSAPSNVCCNLFAPPANGSARYRWKAASRGSYASVAEDLGNIGLSIWRSSPCGAKTGNSECRRAFEAIAHCTGATSTARLHWFQQWQHPSVTQVEQRIEQACERRVQTLVEDRLKTAQELEQGFERMYCTLATGTIARFKQLFCIAQSTVEKIECCIESSDVLLGRRRALRFRLSLVGSAHRIPARCVRNAAEGRCGPGRFGLQSLSAAN
jgi:hypothetical protein